MSGVGVSGVDVSGVDVSGNRASFHVTILLGDEGTRSKVLILVRAVSCIMASRSLIVSSRFWWPLDIVLGD